MYLNTLIQTLIQTLVQIVGKFTIQFWKKKSLTPFHRFLYISSLSKCIDKGNLNICPLVQWHLFNWKSNCLQKSLLSTSASLARIWSSVQYCSFTSYKFYKSASFHWIFLNFCHIPMCKLSSLLPFYKLKVRLTSNYPFELPPYTLDGFDLTTHLLPSGDDAIRPCH
jgi:hypothetical protein